MHCINNCQRYSKILLKLLNNFLSNKNLYKDKPVFLRTLLDKQNRCSCAKLQIKNSNFCRLNRFAKTYKFANSLSHELATKYRTIWTNCITSLSNCLLANSIQEKYNYEFNLKKLLNIFCKVMNHNPVHNNDYHHKVWTWFFSVINSIIVIWFI